MICEQCSENCLLKFKLEVHEQETFYWLCPRCEAESFYRPPEERFDFANDDFSTMLKSFGSISNIERQEIEYEIKAQMIEILKHFFECDWGAHYNTMFQALIKVYLADAEVLDYVLKEKIKSLADSDFKNKIKILRRTNSKEIRNYLDERFITIN